MVPIRDVEIFFTSPISIDGRPCLYSAIHDITERKQAEAMQDRLQEQLPAQKLESVGRLAGGVAHDLNNMLSPILGYGEVLLGDMVPGDPHGEYVRYSSGWQSCPRPGAPVAGLWPQADPGCVAADLNQIVSGFLQPLSEPSGKILPWKPCWHRVCLPSGWILARSNR